MSTSDLSKLAEAAGVPEAIAEHHAPLLRLLLAAVGEADVSEPAPMVDLADAGFDLFRSYAAAEAAEILGIQRARSLYDIDELLLPRSRVGPAGTSVRFFGLDLLCYMKGLRPVDYDAIRDEAEARLRRLPAGPVRAMPGGRGRRRVQ